ncbi:MAG: hypothetical protein R3C44_04915 [Chloroflexota bacterium]
MGLADVGRDDLQCVRPTTGDVSPTDGPLVVSAHLDTVFPWKTDLTLN